MKNKIITKEKTTTKAGQSDGQVQRIVIICVHNLIAFAVFGLFWMINYFIAFLVWMKTGEKYSNVFYRNLDQVGESIFMQIVIKKKCKCEEFEVYEDNVNRCINCGKHIEQI